MKPSKPSSYKTISWIILALSITVLLSSCDKKHDDDSQPKPNDTDLKSKGHVTVRDCHYFEPHCINIRKSRCTGVFKPGKCDLNEDPRLDPKSIPTKKSSTNKSTK